MTGGATEEQTEYLGGRGGGGGGGAGDGGGDGSLSGELTRKSSNS